jgi:hypothetical protein
VVLGLPTACFTREGVAVATIQRDALEQTLRAGSARLGDQHLALIGLCRLLADQLDDAGSDASTRLTAAYLSALKDLGKVLGEVRESVGGKLAAVRALRGQQKSTNRRGMPARDRPRSVDRRRRADLTPSASPKASS